MAERIRTTISLDPEVHAIFVAMAEAAGTSVSRCMGDWLADTAEGAQFVAGKMQEARRAPKTVMREMQAMARGLVAEVDQTVSEVRRKSLAGRDHPAQGVDEAGQAAGGGRRPPSSLTGVNTPRRGKSA